MANNVEIVVKVKDKATALMKRMMQTTKDMFRNLTSLASLLMSAGSIAVPLFAKSLVMAAHGGAAVGSVITPLLGLVPALAGGMMFLKFTLGGVADAWKKAFKKSDELKNLQKQVGDMALKGVPALARSFQKLTFSKVKEDMLGVGKGLNEIIKGTLKWGQSAEGIKAITSVTHQTSQAFRQLAPDINAAIRALGNLAGRGSEQAIGGVEKAVRKLLRALTEWANNTTAQDMRDAWEKLKIAVSGVADKLKVVWSWIQYIAESSTRVKAIGDAFAVVGIIIGAMMGNWVAMAIGAVSIIINHWSTLKDFFTGLWQQISSNAGFQGVQSALSEIVDTVKSDMSAALSVAKDAFTGLINALKAGWNSVAPFVEGFLRNEQVITGIRTIAIGLVSIVIAFGLLATAAVVVATAVQVALSLLVSWLIGFVVASVKWFVQQCVGAWNDLKAMAERYSALAVAAWNWCGQALSATGNFIVGVWNWIKTAWSGAVNFISSGARSVGNFFTSMGRTISSAATSAMNTARSIFNSAMNSIRTAVNNGVNNIRNLFNSIKGIVTKAFSGAGSWLLQAGRDIVNGMVSGIRNSFGKVSSAIGSLKSMVPGFAHGGIIGAATGGVRSGMTLVGEHGPELVNLAPGSRVHSNPDSRRMMGGGGYGGGASTVILDSAGSRMDELLLEILRKAIRVRGGNVQNVLGRSR